MDLKRYFRGPVVWVIVLALVGLALLHFVSVGDAPKAVSTAKVDAAITQQQVAKATIKDKEQLVVLKLKSGDSIQASYPVDYDTAMLTEIKKYCTTASGCDYTTTVSHDSILSSLFFSIFPIIVVVGLLLFFMNQMQGGGSRVMNFGKAKAKLVTKETPKTTFADVAGADEAIEELQEIKEFLENPAKFQAVGAKIPKGVLLYGPPGTGKTLLARAVAGEAGVPFYAISGSDFVEMFVGVGASRVRDLFEQAKTNAPAIIFIDEIDAVGRHRGAGLGGGHDEREQTLNQLLVEMDGFDVKGGVILIAATNRPDILDPALLRPGRFDRQIVVDRPDLEGRKGILKVHAKGKPMGPDADLDVIARRTPGFTGADLANVINEAALLTARMDEHVISGKTLEESIDRVMAGPERKSRVMSDKEKKIIAYHEGGHALVAHALPNSDPVHKVTILPRGRALGYTMTLPTEDKFLTTRSEMVDQLAMLLGGRTAEELVFHEPTTGASNDIEKATQISRAMITDYGMSDRLGARKFGQSEGEVFLGRDMGHQRDYSEQIAAAIDDEVRGLIESAHDVAWEILVQYRDVLDDLVLKLMDKETLTKDEVLAVFAPVQRRPLRASYSGWGKRKPSDQPPVQTPRELALLGAADVRELTDNASGSSNGSGLSTNGYGSSLGSPSPTSPTSPTSGAPDGPPPPTPAGPAPTVEPPSSQPGS